MSISNTTEDAILKLVFQGTAWANYADPAATANQTQVGVSLHTADPGETGDATTSEITYTSYTRVNVPRSNATPGWSEASGVVSPTANVDFPQGGAGGSPIASHFATAKSNASPPTGTQPILWSGTISPNITTGNGVTPRLTTASTITLD